MKIGIASRKLLNVIYYIFLRKYSIHLIHSVNSAVFQEVLDEEISDSVDDEPHVVGVRETSQVAIGLRSGFFLLFEFSRHVLDTWMVLLGSSVISETDCQWSGFDFFLK